MLLRWLSLMQILEVSLYSSSFCPRNHSSWLAQFHTFFFLQDEATVRELAADERAGDVKGWLQRLHAWLFEGDIFASVASNDVLLRIHSTAEEFEGAAEDCFVPQQVFQCLLTVSLPSLRIRKVKKRMLFYPLFCTA